VGPQIEVFITKTRMFADLKSDSCELSAIDLSAGVLCERNIVPTIHLQKQFSLASQRFVLLTKLARKAPKTVAEPTRKKS